MAATLCGLVDRVVGSHGRCCERCPFLIDALLEFREVARVEAVRPEAVVAAFCRLRKQLEARDYLAAFRLRRHLEEGISVVVRVPGGEDARRRLDLRWRSFERLVGSYRREAFEMAEGADFEAIEVQFVSGGPE